MHKLCKYYFIINRTDSSIPRPAAGTLVRYESLTKLQSQRERALKRLNKFAPHRQCLEAEVGLFRGCHEYRSDIQAAESGNRNPNV